MARGEWAHVEDGDGDVGDSNDNGHEDTGYGGDDRVDSTSNGREYRALQRNIQ